MADGTVVVAVKLLLEGREIEGAAEVPTGSAPRRVLLPVLRGLTDAIVGLAEGVTCAKGCDACCRQMVPISVAEAAGLQETLAGMKAAARRRVLSRWERALEKLRPVMEQLRGRAELDAAALERLDRDYFALQAACPFLEAGACAIHAQRPLACREFVVRSDPRHCADPGGGGVERVEIGARVSVALREAEGRGWLPLVLARELCEADNVDPVAELRRVLKGL